MDKMIEDVDIQKIISKMAGIYQRTLAPAYDYEDIQQEGVLVYLEQMKMEKKWSDNNHFNRYFQASMRNHLNDLCGKIAKGLNSEKMSPQGERSNMDLKLLLADAPKRIRNISLALAKTIEAGEKPSSQNVCQYLGISSAHHNPVKEFRDYIAKK